MNEVRTAKIHKTRQSNGNMQQQKKGFELWSVQ